MPIVVELQVKKVDLRLLGGVAVILRNIHI